MNNSYKNIFKIPKFKLYKNLIIPTKTVITIRIDNNVLKTIDMSRNEFIVQYINFALDNMKLN